MNQVLENTFVLTPGELIKEYRRNRKFRELLETGSFIYIDGMLVANSPQSIALINGQPNLVLDVRKNPLGYALSFDVVHLPLHKGIPLDFNDPEKNQKSKSFDPDKNSMLPEGLGKIVNRQKELYDFVASLPRNLGFWEMMGRFIEKEGSNLYDFEEKTQLNEAHYYRAKRSVENPEKVKHVASKSVVLAFAAGYDLTRKITDLFLEAAEKTLSLTSNVDIHYAIVLDTMIGIKMDIKNEWLESNEIPRLGSNQRI